LSFLKQSHAELLNRIESTKDLDAASEKELEAAIGSFKKTWA